MAPLLQALPLVGMLLACAVVALPTPAPPAQVLFNITVAGGSNTITRHPNIIDHGLFHLTANHVMRIHINGTVAWRAYPPWTPTSAPFVVEGSVVAMRYSGELLAFDAATGLVSWRVPQDNATLSSSVTGALAIAKDPAFTTIFLPLQGGYSRTHLYLQAYAVTPNGAKLVWNATMHVTSDYAVDVAGSLYHDGVVYTVTNNGVFMNSAKDGHLVHTYNRSGCFAEADGQWAFIQHGLLVFSAGHGFAVAAIDVLWALTCRFTQTTAQRPRGAVLVNNTIVTAANDGVRAYDATDGRGVWWRNLSGVSGNILPGKSSAVVAVDGMGLLQLDIATGRTTWAFSAGILDDAPFGLATAPFGFGNTAIVFSYQNRVIGISRDNQ